MEANLVFIIDDAENRVLLIHKKTGLGAGKINAPGGKLESGETALEAAVREVEEELLITPTGLEEMGELRFAFVDGLHLHCTVFRARGYADGEPTETREAKPEWFSIPEVPYDKMWADDEFWLPQMFEGQKFQGRFEFDGETMLSKQVEFFD